MNRINQFIKKYAIVEDVELIAESTDLIKIGAIDSLFTLQLLSFLEEDFQIEVGIDELELSNFKSIEAIKNYVIKNTKPGSDLSIKCSITKSECA